MSHSHVPPLPHNKHRRTCSHYSYYLRDGMSVLEFGAAEDSYLPGGLRLGRHVGVGLSVDQMAQNDAITETLEVDLNSVVAENGVDSDELRALGASKKTCPDFAHQFGAFM